MFRIDTPGATGDNKFTSGSPTTGTPSTRLSADFFNALQEEIIAVILAASGTLDKTNNHQLRDAITSLIAGGGVTVNAAGVGIADVGDYYAGTEVESALQQLAAKLYAGTLNANQIRRSIFTDATTALSMANTHMENVGVLSNAGAINYTVVPESTYNAPIGSAVTLFQGGAGKITIVPGSGVILKYPSVFAARSLGQEANVTLVKTATNTWRIGGMLDTAP